MSVGPGAEVAFTEFVARSYVALVRTGYLLTGDRGPAEDLVQQCLMTTYRSWHRLQGRDSAEAYTRTSMVRQAVRWRSRRWRGEVPTGDRDGRVEVIIDTTQDQFGTREITRQVCTGPTPGTIFTFRECSRPSTTTPIAK